MSKILETNQVRLIVVGPDEPTNRQRGMMWLDTDAVPGLNVVGTKAAPITSNFTAAAGDDLIICNGTFSVFLPTAVGISGTVIRVNQQASGGTITVDADGSELINASGTSDITAQFTTVGFCSDGAGWVFV